MTAHLAISETDWQDQVVQLARLQGWRTMHVRRTRGRGGQHTTATSVAGWPDLILWHPSHGVIAAELKSDTGRVSPEQAQVLRDIAAAGIPAAVWRPGDLRHVHLILTRGWPRHCDTCRRPTP